MSGEDEGPSPQQISFQKQIGAGNVNQPRNIRARTGQTSDPIPEGKHISGPECVTVFSQSLLDLVLFSAWSWYFATDCTADA